MPVTSLMTTESLAKRMLVKASMACANRARTVKVSSASRALSKRKVSKCVQLTQGAGLKNRGRGFDVGGSHHESRPDERWQPRSLPPASTQRTPPHRHSVSRRKGRPGPALGGLGTYRFCVTRVSGPCMRPYNVPNDRVPTPSAGGVSGTSSRSLDLTGTATGRCSLAGRWHRSTECPTCCCWLLPEHLWSYAVAAARGSVRGC